jgi:hypothetical protein
MMFRRSMWATDDTDEWDLALPLLKGLAATGDGTAKIILFHVAEHVPAVADRGGPVRTNAHERAAAAKLQNSRNHIPLELGHLTDKLSRCTITAPV